MEMTYWPRHVEEHGDRDGGVNESHPMRSVTEQVATSRQGWSPERATKVRDLFDSMADEWSRRNGIERTEALLEALDRLRPRGRTCLELGCGTGSVLGHLGESFERAIGIDLSMEMLTKSQCAHMAMAQADSSRLPFPDHSIDVIVVVNSFLFVEEYQRVLDEDGTIIWVSTNGDRTPIYLSPERVHELLGEQYYGVSAPCGNGVWSAFSRTRYWPTSDE